MFRRKHMALAIVMLALPLSAFGQEKDRNIYDACAIPRSWQPALIERIKQFAEYQRDGEWEKIANMLGPLFNEQNRTKYTRAQRESTIAKIRTHPMVAFTPEKVIWSTGSFVYPLHKRWWYISGQGAFPDGATTQVGRAEIIAYRYHGVWYFKPLIATASNKSLDASGG